MIFHGSFLLSLPDCSTQEEFHFLLLLLLCPALN